MTNCRPMYKPLKSVYPFILSMLILILPAVSLANWISDFSDIDEEDYFIDNDAYWDNEEEYAVLTEAVGNQNGKFFWDEAFPTGFFVAEFDIRIGGGTGADGMVFAWVPDYTYEATGGGSHNFEDTGGYGVEFDCYYNGDRDENGQHIDLLDGTNTNSIARWNTDEGTIEDNEWHSVKVVNINGSVEIYFDEELVIEHEIEDYDDFEGYFGFVAATGGSHNWHIFDNVSVIVSGPEFSMEPENIEFGAIVIGDTTAAEVIISNISEEEGDVYNLSYTFTEREDWLEILNGEGELEPGASDTVTIVAYSAELEEGWNETTIIVETNDFDYPEVELPVSIFVTEGFGVLYGTVMADYNDEALGGIEVTAFNEDGDRMGYDETAEDGSYMMELPELTYIVNFVDPQLQYLPYTMGQVDLQVGDSLELNAEMLHADLEVASYEISGEVTVPDTFRYGLEISNIGDGVLDWTAMVNVPSVEVEIGEPLDTIFAGATVENNRLNGAIFVNGKFYVTGEVPRVANYIYVFEQNGELSDTWVQYGDESDEMNGLTFDGELIWGCVDDKLIGFTPDGEVMDSLRAPRTVRYLAWDAGRGCFWVASTTTDIYPVYRDGNIGDPIELEDTYISGLCYMPDDEDGMNLYISSLAGDDRHDWRISRMNPATGDTATFLYFEDVENGGTALTPLWDPLSWVLTTTVDQSEDDGGDLVVVYQMGAKKSWITLDPMEGSLEPEESVEVQIESYSMWMPAYDYSSEIIFSHNGFGQTDTVTFDLTVTVPEPPDEPDPPTPFHLVTPEDSAYFLIFNWGITDTARFVWTSSSDPDTSDFVNYSLFLRCNELESTVSFAAEDTSTEIEWWEICEQLGMEDLGNLFITEIEWWVRVVSGEDTIKSEETFILTLEGGISVGDENRIIPISFGLHSVYPNPFNSSLKIDYGIEVAGDVELMVYDFTGRLVETLYSGNHSRGNVSLNWDARNVPSGLYFVKLRSQDKVEIRKALLIR